MRLTRGCAGGRSNGEKLQSEGAGTLVTVIVLIKIEKVGILGDFVVSESIDRSRT